MLLDKVKRVVSRDIFTSFTVFWRACRATQNTRDKAFIIQHVFFQNYKLFGHALGETKTSTNNMEYLYSFHGLFVLC